jgi:uncharacterized protein YjiS (DUF1127 family)
MTTTTHAATTPSFRDTLSHAFERMMNWVEAHSEMSRSAELARKLEAMSDADLAKLGIARDRIYAHAFARYFYI